MHYISKEILFLYNEAIIIIIIVVLVVVQNRAIRRNNQTSTKQNNLHLYDWASSNETNIDIPTHTHTHRTLEDVSFSNTKDKETPK